MFIEVCVLASVVSSCPSGVVPSQDRCGQVADTEEHPPRLSVELRVDLVLTSAFLWRILNEADTSCFVLVFVHQLRKAVAEVVRPGQHPPSRVYLLLTTAVTSTVASFIAAPFIPVAHLSMIDLLLLAGTSLLLLLRAICYLRNTSGKVTC